MRATFLASAFVATSLLPSFSFAQEVQSAENIVQFYAKAIDLGAQRSICVGTEEECAARRLQDNIPTGLDMLVNFDLDSSELSEEARGKLSQFAKALKDNRLRSHSFVVEGHTDARGAGSYNERLSERRANSVTAFLVSNGVEASRLQAVGKGMSSPRAADPYDPINRRVEMRINIQ